QRIDLLQLGVGIGRAEQVLDRLEGVRQPVPDELRLDEGRAPAGATPELVVAHRSAFTASAAVGSGCTCPSVRRRAAAPGHRTGRPAPPTASPPWRACPRPC